MCIRDRYAGMYKDCRDLQYDADENTVGVRSRALLFEIHYQKRFITLVNIFWLDFWLTLRTSYKSPTSSYLIYKAFVSGLNWPLAFPRSYN